MPAKGGRRVQSLGLQALRLACSSTAARSSAEHMLCLPELHASWAERAIQGLLRNMGLQVIALLGQGLAS